MTDQVALTTTGPLPITALALLLVQQVWDEPARGRIVAALQTPVVSQKHHLIWEKDGVTLSVKTISDSVVDRQNAYGATLTMDVEA